MSTIAQLLATAFSPAPPADPPPAPHRRKKVWELPTRWHCPLVGTCLPVADMRKIAARADLRQLDQLKRDNTSLRDDAAALRRGLTEAQRQKDKAIDDLRRQLADTEQRAALLARRELELAQAQRQARDYETLFNRAEAMGRRIETLEERNAGHARRAGELELALADMRVELTATDTALEMALGNCDARGCGGVSGDAGCGKTCPAEARLAGRCVLCIGGRTNLVEGYRRLVETQGGRFLHHDGGQEESLHRIDAAVGGADAVVRQSGCVSHAAYYRLKEACKKLGKPCVFVKSPGMGSFARGLVTLASPPGGADQTMVDHRPIATERCQPAPQRSNQQGVTVDVSS
jgi:hypothetical protein